MALAPITAEPSPTADRARLDRRFVTGNVAALAVLFVATIYFLLPLYWLIISSTKSTSDLLSTFGLWLSNHWNLWANLQQTFSYGDHIYVRWLANTALYDVVSALIGTAVAAM